MTKIIKSLLRKDWIYILLCITVFSSLTLLSIGKFSVWHDEGYTATLIENSFIGIIERTALDVHPPLYYLVLKAWSLIVGESIFSLRLFSLVTMLGAILVTWCIIRGLFGDSKAKFALALMSTGPFLVRYGQEMRMYGMVALITSLSTYLYIRIFKSKFKFNKYLAAYIFLLTAGIYTQYFFSVVPVVHLIHSLIYRKVIRIETLALIKRYLIIIGLVFLFFLPWVPSLINQFIKVQGAFWIEPVSVQTLTNTPIFMTIYRYQEELKGFGGLLGVISLTAVLLLVRNYFVSSKDSYSRLLFMLVIAPPALFFIFSLPPFQPSYYDRYFSFTATFFYSILALGALGIKNIRHRKMVSILIMAILVVGQINQYIIGNEFEENDRPHYTINQIIDYVGDGAPIYSTSLGTFFDARTTARDKDKGEVSLLLDTYPTSWVGNWSALYERPELISTSIPSGVDSFWLIEDSGSKYSSDQLDNFIEVERLESGYALIRKLQRN